MKPEKRIFVGSFEFGWQTVDLFLQTGLGGSFAMVPEKGKPPRIIVGAQDTANHWKQCYCVLTHEAWELAMFQADIRFSPTNRVVAESHADYLFVMTHEQFHACCAKVSEFMVQAVPALAEAFNKWHGPTKKKGKKR